MTIAVTRSGAAGTRSHNEKAGEPVPDGTVNFLRIGSLDLERGGHLPDVTLAYET